MVQTIKGIFLCIIVLTGLTGCMARIVVEDLPISVSRHHSSDQVVPVFDADMAGQSRAAIPFALIGAHGNGYADKQFLKNELGRQGDKFGADFVVLNQTQLNQGPTVISFSSSLAISETIQTLSAYGVACVYSPIRLGFAWKRQDFSIIDVVPGSPAHKAGVRIGDRLLSLNGKRVVGNALAVYQVSAKAKPGDIIAIELVDPRGEQRILRVIAEENN